MVIIKKVMIVLIDKYVGRFKPVYEKYYQQSGNRII
jgi:hypothetical protein